jgi:hypothetical protein
MLAAPLPQAGEGSNLFWLPNGHYATENIWIALISFGLQSFLISVSKLERSMQM